MVVTWWIVAFSLCVEVNWLTFRGHLSSVHSLDFSDLTS